MEPTKVQATEVMVTLKVVESSVLSEEVVPETVASDALNSGKTSINLNLVSEDDFDRTTYNHISPTPSPIPSPKHTSLPTNELTGVHNQLVEFSASEQPSPLKTMLEPPIDVSNGKGKSPSSET